MKRYTIDHHSLGEHRFNLQSPIGPFYTGLLAAFAWAFGISVVIFVAVGIQLGGVTLESLETEPTASFLVIGGVYAAILLAFFPAVTIYRAFTRNVVYNSTELDGGHSFVSDIQPITMVWIAVSNAVVVLMTLGLMLPWARIRMARYLAAHTTLVAGDSLDRFVGKMEERATAVGDAYSDIEGIELGLPI